MYTFLGTDLYTTKKRDIAALVDKESKLVLARYRNGRCTEVTGGITKIWANILYDRHIFASWYEMSRSYVRNIAKQVGQVRE